MLNKMRRFFYVFGIGLYLLTVLFSVFAQNPGYASAAADTVEKDIQRRQMHYLSKCLAWSGDRSSSAIDINRDLRASTPSDVIGDKMTAEVVVAGYDFDDTDGVVTCDQIIREGVNTLVELDKLSIDGVPEGRDGVGEWLFEYLTGKSPGSLATGSKVNEDSDAWNAKLQELVGIANDVNNSIGAPTGSMRQRRFVPLLNGCYEVDSVRRQDFDDNTDFQNGDLFMYLKDANGQGGVKGWMDSIGVKDNGTDYSDLGDIGLGFSDQGGIASQTSGDFDPKESDFYPIGNDIDPPRGIDYTDGPDQVSENSIVDCDFISRDDVQAIIFDGSVVAADGVLSYTAGSVNANEQATEGDVAAGNDADSCESAADFAFNFILCPILGLSDQAIAWLDNRIVSALSVNNEFYRNDEIKEVWGNLRNIAYVVLIPVMLLMVIGTALQFSFVDPYTVKRAMPRLIVAAIFMAVSYDICVLFIDTVNIVGRGIGGLIAQPFGGYDSLTLQRIFEPTGLAQNALFTGGVLVGVGVAFLSGVTIWVLFSFLGVGALALLLIFLLLSIRELIIIFLLVISPLAIIAWIFPGNDKMWKLWWSSFSKLLYVYPIIIALLTVGRGFAAVVNDVGGEDFALVDTIVKLVAFIGPYFFIPKAFQMAGGAFAQIAGMANDRSKGLFDRQKKWRGEQRKNKKERIHNEKGIRDNGMLGKRLSFEARQKLNTRLARTAAAGKVAGDGGGLRDWKSRTDAVMAASSKHERKHILESEEESSWIGNDYVSGLASDVLSGNEEGLRSVMTDTFGYTGKDLGTRLQRITSLRNSGNFKGALEEAFAMADDSGNSKGQAFQGDTNFRNVSVAQVMQAQAKYGNEGLRQAMVLKAMAGGTYYVDAMDTWRASELAAGHDRNAKADMAIEGRKALMATGRADTGSASFGQTLGIQGEIERGMEALSSTGSYTISMGKGRGTRTVTSDAELRSAVNKRMTHTVLDQNGAGVLAHQSMKTGYIETNVIPVMQERIQQAHDTYGEDSQEYKAEIASAESLWKSLGQTKPEMMKIFGDKVMAYDPKARRELSAAEQTTAKANGIDTHTARAETIRFNSDPVYQNYQYQYGAAAAQAGATGGAAAAGAAAGAAAVGGAVPPPTAAPSDVRLKKNIEYLETVNSLKLYSFTYVWDNKKKYVGVMAQDLLESHPEALIVDEFGYYKVDYSLLGIKMIGHEEWTADPSSILVRSTRVKR